MDHSFYFDLVWYVLLSFALVYLIGKNLIKSYFNERFAYMRRLTAKGITNGPQ